MTLATRRLKVEVPINDENPETPMALRVYCRASEARGVPGSVAEASEAVTASGVGAVTGAAGDEKKKEGVVG